MRFLQKQKRRALVAPAQKGSVYLFIFLFAIDLPLPMCINVCMEYKIPKSKYYMIRDMARALDYNAKLDLDRRIQVKMPSFVVDTLDAMFPKTDRSTLLTKLALQAILDNIYIETQPDDGWASFIDMEKEANKDMLDYLEKREAQNG